MGRLKHLELENFKSYAGTQIVGPFDDFTCVIGPNGSGKSNMMDAISFVLGVQSRHLRSTHLKELIFRKDAHSAPARKASVKLVYVVSKGEFRDKAEGTEVHFSRSISATGVSTYKLDNRDVTYEVYEETLQTVGVLVKARNFLVFQGDVESVASKSPAELTKLLEQISGSDALKAEYEELSVKNEEAIETTTFSLQKKKMYATQKKEVKEQKDEAEAYQEKQEEIDRLKSEHVLFQIWKVRDGQEGHQEAAQALRQELSEAKEKEGEFEEEMNNAKKELAKMSKALAAAEKTLAGREKEVSAVSPKLEETRARLKGLRKRILELDKGIKNVQSDRNAQAETISGLREDMSACQEAERKFKSDLDKISGAGVQLDAQKLEEYTQLREQVSARTAKERAEELTLDQEIKSKKLHLQRLETQSSGIGNEGEGNERLIAEYADRVGKLETAIRDGTRDANELERERDRINEEMRSSKQRADTLATELEEVTSKLRDAGEDRRRNKQEERIGEAIETMQRIFTGVHGKLVDLCRPIQRKYDQAVATAAGKQMDAIVVDTKQVAADCIRYLKDQRVGTCIFLPLDNMDSKAVPDRLRTFAPKYRLCVDLVECEDKFKSAVAYAFGSTLVCDTLEEAQDLCFNKGERIKVVTVKGHVISKNGAMTGGASARDGQNRWEEKEVERLRRRKSEVEEESARNKQTAPTRQQQVDLETRLKTLTARIQFSKADKTVTEKKLTELRGLKASKDTLTNDLIREMESVKKEVTKSEKKLVELQRKIREEENEVFKSFSAEVGNFREFEENQEKQHQKHQELVRKRSAVAEQLASLTAQLEYEQKRDFTGALQRLQGQLTEAQASVGTQEAAERELLDKEEQLRAALRVATDKLGVAKDDRASANTAVKNLQSRRTAVTQERDAISKKLAAEEIQIERARAQLHEVLLKAQVDEVALPTVQLDESEDGEGSELRWSGSQASHRTKGGDGGGRVSSKRKSSSSAADAEESYDEESESGSRDTSKGSKVTGSTHFSQSDNVAVVRDQRNASKVDLSSMRKCKNMSKNQLAEFDNNLVKQVAALVVELEGLQPNMHAVERYKGVVEKLKECEQELDKVREDAKDVLQRFDEVKKERQKRFQDCFDHVSETLGVVYRDLTKSSKHPLGGNAYLTLDNTEEPYKAGTRFTAMPPMKRFRDMEQLSGGEKTMAALALLFSIHSFRQAPFFVLDEVDAALDNVNVKKICNYIRQRSREFQCVVISLKDMFFEHADSLVGVCKDVDSLSSNLLTLNLKEFDPPGRGGGGGGGGGGSAMQSPASSKGTSPSVGSSNSHKRKISDKPLKKRPKPKTSLTAESIAEEEEEGEEEGMGDVELEEED